MEETIIGALDGCRVLDFTRVLAGPMCTMMLSDMGAEVVKVEEPGRGDHSRAYGPPFLNGESVYFMSYNRGKRSVTLNLKHPRGQELMRELVTKVDVLFHNYQRGFVFDVGLDYESIKDLNPNLIYCWISAYGEGGPYAEKGAVDNLVMGLSGIMSITGEPNGPPIKSTISFSDILSAYNATVGILAALRARDKTGKGGQVKVNLLDSAVAMLGSLASNYFVTGEAPGRIAPDVHPGISPAGAFKTNNGYISIAGATMKQYPNLCSAIGLEELVNDPDFATNTDRVRNRKQLREKIEAVMATKSSDEWMKIFDAKGVLAEPINTIEEAMAHPQVVHNQLKQTIKHPTAGPITLLRTPFELPTTPLSFKGPPPRLGEHTRKVLGSYLGLADKDLDQLQKEGVI